MVYNQFGCWPDAGQYLAFQEIWSVFEGLHFLVLSQGLLYIVAFVFEGLYFMVFSLLYIVVFHTELSKYTKGVSRNKHPYPTLQK